MIKLLHQHLTVYIPRLLHKDRTMFIQRSNPFQAKDVKEERLMETGVQFDFSAFLLVRNPSWWTSCCDPILQIPSPSQYPLIILLSSPNYNVCWAFFTQIRFCPNIYLYSLSCTFIGPKILFVVHENFNFNIYFCRLFENGCHSQSTK